MKRHLATLAVAVALTVMAATAWAYLSAGSVPGGNGAAAASGVNQGATPAANATGSTVTVSWSATTLANGQAVSGYVVKRFDAGTQAAQTILSACTGTIATTSCVESGVPNGSWKYTVTPVLGSWQGLESAKSATVTVNTDPTAPTNSISLSSVTGGAYLTGSTIFYRGATAGGLRLTNAVADAGSGPASGSTAALTGTTAGWTHAPSMVSTPAGGPYVSSAFDWAAGTTSSPAEAVTGRDVAGNTAVTNLTFTNDSTPPTSGTISYANGYVAGLSVGVSFTTGTDAGSGIATRRLQRANAPMTGTSCGTFGAFADLGTANPTSPYVDTSVAVGCYKYRYVVTDRVGNQDVATSASVAKIGYAAAVDATAGLLSHWPLGEAAQTLISTDAFTGTSGSSLAVHSDGLGTIWKHQAGAANAVITDTNRVRRNAADYTIDYVDATPPSANYSVEADLDVMSNLASDTTGVIGRLNTATNTFYLARWEQSASFGTGTWRLARYNNGTVTSLGALTGQAEPVQGETYRIKLEMIGSSLALFVNGVLKVSATDATITAAGKAGIMDGADAGSSSKSNATGLHLDDFQVTPSTYARAADTKGSNTGDYKNGVTLGVPGAVAGGTTAAAFDGVNDYVQMTNATGLPTAAAVRSTELWFKTSSSARQVLFRYGSGASNQEYGLWIDAGGASMTAWGWGGGNDKTFAMPSAVNNGAWHHLVETYNGASLVLYIDGAALPAQAATRATAMDMYGFGIGAVIRPSDSNSGGFFNGSIDEVSFYTTVLNQTTVTDHYLLGLAPAVDLTGPTGGSVDATGLVGSGSRYATSTTLSLALAKGTDPSGVATTGNLVLRASAPLTGNTCGGFGAYSLVTGGTDPASPLADTVADQACHSYQYVVLDTLGNATTYTSPNIKVDTSAPSVPALALSAFTNTWWPGSGATVFYRSAATSGSVVVTATATDATAGIASYAFPALGTNWTSTPGALGVNTYSWSGAPAAPGTKNVTATNNASLASANAPVTFTADNTAPTSGTVTYPDATQTSTSVAVAFTTGTDSQSGLETRVLQRSAAPLSGTSCGTYGAFATVPGGTNPTSPFTDTVTTGTCYKYQYVVSDNVGNTTTATSANVVKVAAACGTQLIGNGGFENGADPTPWTSTPAGVVTNNGTVAARTGSWKAQLGGQGVNSNETLSQVVSIPGGNCTATLSYYLRVTTNETTHPWDFFRVQVISGGTTEVQTFDDGDFGGSYVQRTVDLSAYAGQTITLRFLSDEDSGQQTTFWVDDVALNTSVASYTDTVSGTPGLVNYYRLGEATTSADSMTGTAGATLQSRNGETAAAWTKYAVSDSDAVLTPAGRVRKTGTSMGAVYFASAVPSSANYTVEADVYVASNLANDVAGVLGRVDAPNGNGYYVRYEQDNQRWVLYRVVNTNLTMLGQSGIQALTAGTTYRLALDLTGTSIRALVDGVQVISATDGAITAVGRAGIALGFDDSSLTTVTDSTGMQLDNFRISPPVADAKGTNHGDWLGGVLLTIAGAIAGDASTAATFDGVNDFATVGRQVADDFSIELWFKSTQGIGTGAQWSTGAGLVDGSVAGAANDFGVSLRSDGKVVAGIGTPDVSVVSTSGGYNNGAWHHVVFTRTKATGALALYVDGVAAGTATGASTASLTSATSLNLGRIQSGGYYFAGSLDEVSIYNVVLSPAAISARFAAAS